MDKTHPAVDMGCTPEDVRVFDAIARGTPPSDFNPEILQHLEEKGLLSILGHDVTIPVMVLEQWSDYQDILNKAELLKSARRA